MDTSAQIGGKQLSHVEVACCKGSWGLWSRYLSKAREMAFGGQTNVQICASTFKLSVETHAYNLSTWWAEARGLGVPSIPQRRGSHNEADTGSVT